MGAVPCVTHTLSSPSRAFQRGIPPQLRGRVVLGVCYLPLSGLVGC